MTDLEQKVEVVESKALAPRVTGLPIDITQIGSLNDADVVIQDVELSGTYWTPEKAGEKKIVVFLGIQDREVFDEETGELTESLKVVHFAALIAGSVTQISNASKRLVAIFNNTMFQPGQKFQVEYIGKKVSTKTGHKYDDWSVKPAVNK
jgi:hypothetical protein